MLAGARQVGKTTLLLQAIQALLDAGHVPTRILHATFDHPLLKLAGPDGVLELWRELEPGREGTELLFLDEIQHTRDWQTWLKHQTDFEKHRRIAVTGSAIPLATEEQESGVGRWHTIRIATMSFHEYLEIRNIAVPDLPPVTSLARLCDWRPEEPLRAGEEARPLVGHFHDYLLRGGFPQTAQIESIPVAQKLLREDIVDKVLRRDMTALFGVRRVLELEQLFLYLCLHGGGLLGMQSLASNLQVKKPTVLSFLNLLEASHLIHKLPPHGYGEGVLRARYKVYLADAAIAPSVLLKGKSLLEDSSGLGLAVETAFFKHVFTRYDSRSIGFSYRRGKKEEEVDIIADVEGRLVPFEVKYRHTDTGPGTLKGLLHFCTERKVDRGYVITRESSDFSVLTLYGGVQVLKIPAALACFWLGQSEAMETG